MKIKSYQDLAKQSIRNLEQKHEYNVRIVVVLSKCSLGVGADRVLRTVQETVRKENIRNTIVEITGCMGMCSEEPQVMVYHSDKRQYMYNLVTCEKARIITISHGIYGKCVKPWLINSKEG